MKTTEKTVSSARSLLQWLFPAATLCFAIPIGFRGAIYAPDAAIYRLLALGRHAAVSIPFSARILGPAIAGWLGRMTGLSIERSFLCLGLACLGVLVFSVGALLRSQQVHTAIFAAIFLMPFWVDTFHDYYLPDLLHAALLAAILFALVRGRTTLAMVLIFPAYLARESTILIVVCMIYAAWRRIPARTACVGGLAAVAGAIGSWHFAGMGPTGPMGVRGAPYMFGKVFWSFSRNVLGLPLWTNTFPDCGNPTWVTSFPFGFHLAAIHIVGLCPPSLWGPTRLLLAWFGIFGVGPALAVALLRSLLSPSALSGASWQRRTSVEQLAGASASSSQEAAERRENNGAVIVFRFSIAYGLVSLLLAPVLGASIDRLVEYGWPFYFIALAWLATTKPLLFRRRNAWILFFHLAACWIAWLAFEHQAIRGYIQAGLFVLALNIATYVMARRFAGLRISGPIPVEQTA